MIGIKLPPKFDEWFTAKNGGLTFEDVHMYDGALIEQTMRALTVEIRQYVSHIATQPAEQVKADLDLILYGSSFMRGGKHIPVQRVRITQQPAEPVKVPSDEEIDVTFRAVLPEFVGWLGYDSVRKFARALLARYGAAQPDYRKILEKYIALVVDWEGTDYLHHASPNDCYGLNSEELAALHVIAGR